MEANLALPAALIGDPVRAAILSALCDGRAQPACALACAAADHEINKPFWRE